MFRIKTIFDNSVWRKLRKCYILDTIMQLFGHRILSLWVIHETFRTLRFAIRDLNLFGYKSQDCFWITSLFTVPEQSDKFVFYVVSFYRSILPLVITQAWSWFLLRSIGKYINIRISSFVEKFYRKYYNLVQFR